MLISMGLKKFLGNVKEKYDEKQEQKHLEEQEFREYQEMINTLIDRFEIPDLDDFFMKYLNNKPESWYELDEDTGREIKQRPSRRHYVDFVWKYLGSEDITYEQVKNYALKKRIVTPSFFGTENDEQFEKSDFEIIVNSIKADFEPEAITNEEHLEAQLMVFLKAKFSERKIRRQVTIQGNDILDILVDDKYAFELKVPRSRTELRNLRGQIEEYQEDYSNLCVVIFENEDYDISEDIEKYVNIYHEKYDVPSVVLHGRKRK